MTLDRISMIQDIISNVVGGILFTLLLFFVNEFFFKTLNVSGEWTSLIKMKQATVKKNIGLGIEYRIHLLQLGNQITGRGEKIRDINSDGTDFYIYPHVKRIEIEITGYYEKNYIKKSKLYLNIKENGTKRTTSASYNLTFHGKNSISGFFVSTAANSRGETSWTRVASSDK